MWLIPLSGMFLSVLQRVERQPKDKSIYNAPDCGAQCPGVHMGDFHVTPNSHYARCVDDKSQLIIVL